MLVYLQWLIIDKYQPGIFVWEHTSQLISEHESISRVSEKLFTQSLEYLNHIWLKKQKKVNFNFILFRLIKMFTFLIAMVNYR